MVAETKKNKLQIRNSTVDFLVFTKDAQEDGIEVRVQDQDVWLTQKAIGQLFDVDRSVVSKTFIKVENYLKRQLVQILHKLRITGKPININSIRYPQLLPSATVSIPAGQHSFGNGQQKCWIPLQSRDTSWTKTD